MHKDAELRLGSLETGKLGLRRFYSNMTALLYLGSDFVFVTVEDSRMNQALLLER